MSRLAYADIPVSRHRLVEPGMKLQIRKDLLAKLNELGYVERIERFVMDPPDGPYRDGTFPKVDRDYQAIIRAEAWITPFAEKR